MKWLVFDYRRDEIIDMEVSAPDYSYARRAAKRKYGINTARTDVACDPKEGWLKYRRKLLNEAKRGLEDEVARTLIDAALDRLRKMKEDWES